VNNSHVEKTKRLIQQKINYRFSLQSTSVYIVLHVINLSFYIEIIRNKSFLPRVNKKKNVETDSAATAEGQGS
jgi:hypothetical protein